MAGVFLVRLQIILGQSVLQDLERGVDVVGELKQVQIVARSIMPWRTSASKLRISFQNVDPYSTTTIFFTSFCGLHQRQDFDQLVERAEAARETRPAPSPDTRTRTCA